MSGPLHLGLVMQGGAGWMGGSEYIKNLAQAVVEAAQGAVRVRPRVEFVAAADIYDPARDAKATRLVDRR